MTAPRTAFEVLTLFPAAIESFVSAGLLGRAIERGLVAVHATDIRTFTTDRHRTVDDAPFGGGAGMVMKAEPVVAALESVEAARGPMHRVLLTPSAPRLDQRIVERLAGLPRIALLCGRYEGIDDRVREHFVDECISLGDFVLGGGEVAALAVIEAVARLLEGVVGNPASITGDSFAHDPAGPLLEYPQYTRPAVFRGHAVPEVLLGGDHAAIERWRTSAALRRTWALRPELRPREPLPAGVPIHLAIAPHGIDDAPALVELVRTHALAGLVLIGASDHELDQWTRATAGRCALTAVADLGKLRRRLKPRSGTAEPGGPRVPWIVAVTRGPSPIPVDAVLDELRTCTRAQPSALVVVADPALGDADVLWTADGPLERASTHAPDPTGCAPPPDPKVAPRAGIADPPAPSSRAAIVARALTGLAVVRPR
jgi:tRNA (guanine37-N1)-methyltransferase